MEVSYIKGTLILGMATYADERGYFREIYKTTTFSEDFNQDNTSFSKAGVIRGLHYQEAPYGQAKYVTCIYGKIIDIIVDTRKDSDTFGQYMKIELSAENGKIVFMPEGVAHGFVAVEDSHILYKCSQVYNPKAEKCIRFDDEFLGINWGVENPIVSEKDFKGDKFCTLFPLYEGEKK
jgi:dTDP-4-dehydrorhamnose 3,5-epimerase